MAAEIPDVEPESFIAGDTVKWTKSLSDYPPASGWILTYYFRGTVPKTIVCTTSGSDFLAAVAATDSAAYPPGEYVGYARVALAGEEYTVWRGTLIVKENPAVGTSSRDGRSHARRMLDAIEAMMEGNASREESEYEISTPGGTSRRLQFCSKADLMAFHSHYKQIVAQEQNAERIAQGKPSRNRILTTFTR